MDLLYNMMQKLIITIEFESSKKTYDMDVVDGPLQYHHVSVQPSSWYQWFSPYGQDDDTGWTPVCV